MRKFFSVLASLVVTGVSLVAAQPAAAVTNFTITVVASGGAVENTTWSYANGEITPTASVSINAADIVAKLGNGPLVVYSGRILINTSITHTTANALTFKSQGNIIVGGGLTLQSQGGDFVFHSDSDSNNTGHVRFGWDATCAMGNITTNGGDIVVGGGADPRTTTTAAQNNDQANTFCPGGTPPLSGVGIYNYTFNAGGGDISVRAGSPNLGTTLSMRALNISGSGGLVPAFQTSGNGNIYLYGDGSQIGHNNAWGFTSGSMTAISEHGDIVIEGRGNPSGPTNARGVAIGQASTFTSSSGEISFIDRTNGALAGYSGLYFGGAITATTSANINFQADEIAQVGALNLTGDTAFIGSTNTSSFTAAYLVGAINAANLRNLVIGSPGNTAAVTIGSTITSGGPLAINGGAVTINAAVTATNSPILVNASASLAQNATITASALNLTGSASYTPGSYTVTGGVAQLAKIATFDTQGGSPVAAVAFAIGGRLVLPAGPSKQGYDFVGWFTSSSGGSPLGANFVPSGASDITIYAQWGVPGSNSMISSWMKVTGSQGETLKLSFNGKYLDTVSKIAVSSGTAKIISQSADQIVVEVTGAEVGEGSIQLVGNSQTLTLGGAFAVSPAKKTQSIASLKLPKTLKVGRTFVFSRTADSGLALTARVSGRCKLTATASTYRLTAKAAPATCRLTLSNQGGQAWLPISFATIIKTSK